VIPLARRNGRPLRIGHRGAAALAPENTLRGFRAALEAGVDLVEFDVLALTGGELVLAHSTDLGEVSHGTARGSLRGRSLEELRELCPELPTLDEALEFFGSEARETGVHLDLKSARAADRVIERLRRFGVVERSLVSSFHLRALRRMAALEPRLRTGVSFPRDPLRMHKGGDPRLHVRGALRGLRTVTPGLARVLLRYSCASTLVLHHGVVGAPVVRYARARGVPVVAWTVDRRKDLERVDEAGVDAVVTNDPTIFVSTLQA
jgi:glycerophosphoryl diester phosphodiesterase